MRHPKVAAKVTLGWRNFKPGNTLLNLEIKQIARCESTKPEG